MPSWLISIPHGPRVEDTLRVTLVPQGSWTDETVAPPLAVHTAYTDEADTTITLEPGVVTVELVLDDLGSSEGVATVEGFNTIDKGDCYWLALEGQVTPTFGVGSDSFVFELPPPQKQYVFRTRLPLQVSLPTSAGFDEIKMRLQRMDDTPILEMTGDAVEASTVFHLDAMDETPGWTVVAGENRVQDGEYRLLFLLSTNVVYNHVILVERKQFRMSFSDDGELQYTPELPEVVAPFQCVGRHANDMVVASNTWRMEGLVNTTEINYPSNLIPSSVLVQSGYLERASWITDWVLKAKYAAAGGGSGGDTRSAHDEARMDWWVLLLLILLVIGVSAGITYLLMIHER